MKKRTVTAQVQSQMSLQKQASLNGGQNNGRPMSSMLGRKTGSPTTNDDTVVRSSYKSFQLRSVNHKLRPLIAEKRNTELTQGGDTTNYNTIQNTLLSPSNPSAYGSFAPLQRNAYKQTTDQETVIISTDVKVEDQSPKVQNKPRLKKSFKKFWKQVDPDQLIKKQQEISVNKFYLRKKKNIPEQTQNSIIKKKQPSCLKAQKVEDFEGFQGEIQQIQRKDSAEINYKVNTYKERDDDYAILANKLAIIHSKIPTFKNKNLAICKSFDPIRVKIRIIPLNKGPEPKGMNSDFYFIEAAKRSLQGNFVQAIDLLKRGLIINPKHFNCRFNFGVLLFKIGLIFESSQEFQACIEIDPHHSWPYLNRAVCLIQFGIPHKNHGELQHHKHDNQQYHYQTQDQQNLLQTGSATDRQIRNSEKMAKKFGYQEQNLKLAIEMCHKVLERNLTDKQLEIDALQLLAVCQFRLKQPMDSVQSLMLARRKFKRMQDDKPRIQIQHQGPTQQYVEMFLENIKFTQYKRSNSFENLAQTFQSDLDSDAHYEQPQKSKQGEKNYLRKMKTHIGNKEISQPIITNEQEQFNPKIQKIAGMLGKQIRALLKHKFEKIVKVVKDSNLDLQREQKFLEDYYKEFFLEQERTVDVDENGQPSKLRFKQMYFTKIDVEKKDFQDCNKYEIEELQKRYDIERWWREDDTINKLILSMMEEIDDKDQDNSEFWLKRIFSACELKSCELEGYADYEKLSFQRLLLAQQVVNQSMHKLSQTYVKSSQAVDDDQNKQMEDIKSLDLKPEDVAKLRPVPKFENIEDYKMNNQDNLVARLKRDNTTFEDVTNMLQNDLEEKEKQREHDKKSMGFRDTRFNAKHLKILEIEYSKNGVKDLKVIDDLCQELRYFKRMSKENRQDMYEIAQIVKFEPNTLVYKQSEPGDFMYVILKGKIRMQKRHQFYKEINLSLNDLGDGEAFGDMSYVDETKPGEKNLFVGVNMRLVKTARQNNVFTIEPTVCFKISNDLCLQILQPQMINPNESRLAQRHQSIQNEAVNQKIKFLQKFDFFSVCPNKVLMPIAMNMQQVDFQYGEYLIKQGQVPKGLYLIKSGMCNVVKVSVTTKPYNPEALPGAKKLIQDSNPLFQKFDPENTFLNGIKRTNRVYQNSRIYLDDQGQQLKGEIKYQDFQFFSKLLPYGSFGGRVLPPFEFYYHTRQAYYGQEYVSRPKDKRKEESEEHYQLKAFLDVVADSGVVETYLITKSEMQYFHDSDLKYIYETLIKTKEADRPCSEVQMQEKFKQHQEWEKKKEKTVDNIRMIHSMERHGALASKIN